MKAEALHNGSIYFGNFFKCRIELQEGEKWEIVHTGGEITVLKRKKVTIEIQTKDLERYFEIEGD